MEGSTFDERAEIVMGDFASDYKTLGNPDGKDRVRVYGGVYWQRDAVVEALNRNKPSGVEALVVNERNKTEGDRSYYVDAVEFCAGVMIPAA